MSSASGTIEAFKAEHLGQAEWTGEPMAKAVGYDASPEEVGRKYVENGGGITVRYDGRIIACMGVVRLWSGVGEVWCFTSAEAARRPRLLCRAALWGIQNAIPFLGLHRVQAHVRMDFPAALRWIRYLGFSQEGVCLAYTADKQDVSRWGRLA